jgi:hypothetical protein
MKTVRTRYQVWVVGGERGADVAADGVAGQHHRAVDHAQHEVAQEVAPQLRRVADSRLLGAAVAWERRRKHLWACDTQLDTIALFVASGCGPLFVGSMISLLVTPVEHYRMGFRWAVPYTHLESSPRHSSDSNRTCQVCGGNIVDVRPGSGSPWLDVSYRGPPCLPDAMCDLQARQTPCVTLLFILGVRKKCRCAKRAW